MDRFVRYASCWCVLWCGVVSVPCYIWSPTGKVLTSWLLCLLCFVTFPNVSWSTSGDVGAVPSSKIFLLTLSKVVILLWIICDFVSCVSHALASVHCCIVVTC